MSKKTKDALLAIVLAAVMYAGLSIVGIGCPFKFITGISCPGCGMTRAYGCVIHGDFHRAFGYHPLFPIAPILVYLVYSDSVKPKKIKKIALFFIAAAFFMVYLFRLFNGNEYFAMVEPAKGLIYRAFNIIIYMISYAKMLIAK